MRTFLILILALFAVPTASATHNGDLEGAFQRCSTRSTEPPWYECMIEYMTDTQIDLAHVRAGSVLAFPASYDPCWDNGRADQPYYGIRCTIQRVLDAVSTATVGAAG